jgi:hypothetical protein
MLAVRVPVAVIIGLNTIDSEHFARAPRALGQLFVSW